MTDKYRFTLWVSKPLIKELRKLAIDLNKSVSQIIEDLIKENIEKLKK